MKNLLYAIAVVAALCASSACSRTPVTPMSELDRVEEAFGQGRYAAAQAMADSLVIGSKFGSLDTWDLCRLSLALMNLGETAGDSEVNTAFAARCVRAAFTRDSDSTALYIRAMNNEDRARLLLLVNINEASHSAPADEDSLYYEE